MKRLSLIFIAVLLAAGLQPMRAQDAAQFEKLLASAAHKATIDGDLKGAIADYQKIVDAAKSNRAVAAQALVRMAECYQKLGDARAVSLYERVVRDYADQTAAVAEARTRLATRGGSSAATLTDRKILTREGELPFATMSPGGASLVFSDEWTSPAILETTTGRVTRLMSEPQEAGSQVLFPLLSPDGKQAVFTWIAGKRIELRLLPNAPGATSRTLLSSGAEIGYFAPRAWSRDGKSLLVELQKKDETWSFAWMNVADGRLQVLKSLDWRRDNGGGLWRTSLSPDGRYFAYAAFAINPASANAPTNSLDKHIYILTADGSSEVDLTAASGINENPVWTADGSHVLFLSDRSGAFDLWAIAMSGGRPAGSPFVVQKNTGRLIPIGMSSAGAYYYVSGASGVPLLSLAEVIPSATKTGSGRQLPDDLVGLRPAWSPDAKYIAFLRPKPGGGDDRELVVRTLDSGEERRYSGTEDAKVDRFSKPLWLHDGHTLLQRVTHPGAPQGSNQSLYRADLKTGDFRELMGFGRFTAGGELKAAIAPDDKTIYLTGPVARPETPKVGRIDRIVAADLETGQQRTVYASGSSTSLAPDLSLSPDGRTLAFFTSPDPADFKNPSVHLARVGSDGTGYRELYGPLFIFGNTKPAWSTDGRSILFAPSSGLGLTMQAGHILRVDAETGRSESTGLEIKGLESFDLSPDGSRIVLSRTSSGFVTELRALENVTAVLKASR